MPNGEIKVPLPDDILLLRLFGSLNTNPSLVKKGRGSGRRQEEGQSVIDEESRSGEDEVHPVPPARREENTFSADVPTIAYSTMQIFKSALKWWYSENKVRLDKDIEQRLDMLIDGYKKVMAQKKKRGIMDISEGKSPLSYNSGYVEICKALMCKALM